MMGNCNRRCYSLQGFEKWNAHQRRWPNPAFHLVVILVEIYMICSSPAKENAPYERTPPPQKKFQLQSASHFMTDKNCAPFARLSPSETAMWLLPRPWPNIQLLLSHTSSIHQLVRCSNQNSSPQKRERKTGRNSDKGWKEEIRYSN